MLCVSVHMTDKGKQVSAKLITWMLLYGMHTLSQSETTCRYFVLKAVEPKKTHDLKDAVGSRVHASLSSLPHDCGVGGVCVFVCAQACAHWGK